MFLPELETLLPFEKSFLNLIFELLSGDQYLMQFQFTECSRYGEIIVKNYCIWKQSRRVKQFLFTYTCNIGSEARQDLFFRFKISSAYSN